MPNEQIDNPIQAFESIHIVEFGRQIADGMDYIGRNNVSHLQLILWRTIVIGCFSNTNSLTKIEAEYQYNNVLGFMGPFTL